MSGRSIIPYFIGLALIYHFGEEPMKSIQFYIPDEIFLSMKETPEEMLQEIRMAAAAKLYEIGKLSSALAAQMAGIPRVSFLQRLSRYRVPIFQLTKQEFVEDQSNT